MACGHTLMPLHFFDKHRVMRKAACDEAVMTREELHALVWSKPMRAAAMEQGISDVTLARHCRKANVPVPPPDHWEKVRTGKKVTPQPLPPLPTVAGAASLSGLFPAHKSSTCLAGSRDLSRPAFKTMDEVTQRIQAAVGEIRVPNSLSRPPLIVARLLRRDEERRAKITSNDLYNKSQPKFDRPIQQRRLRILSTLILALEKLGLKVYGSKHAGEEFTVSIRYLLAVHFLLAIEGGEHGYPFYGEHLQPPSDERLRFDITSHSPESAPPLQTWRDDATPLEDQLGKIACGLLLTAEAAARRGAVQSYELAVKNRAEEAQKTRVAAERAKAERAAREAAAAKARFTALMDGADALERAERIRRYVAAVQARVTARPDMAEPSALRQWAAWALAEADALDPVLSRLFKEELLTPSDDVHLPKADR
ncbi:hypothetical protein E2C06_33555 [Dankookia rubra]|uniref:Uncharacterized protein n=1 Tax=Dankookia rubra TaxID=1442381 RepID=A0A4R5Q5V6_9PROT|nr:hypothetical protein [Dankookia rubra]TDH58260.1 hypothetical protein E2C06_33555 [Dankookia rubra]